MNRSSSLLWARFVRDILSSIRNHHWKKLGRGLTLQCEVTALVLAAPLEYLVRVHSVQTSHLGNTRTGRKRLFHDPPLLFNRPPPPAALRASSNQFRIHTDALLHTGILYAPINDVQTARTKRLPKCGPGSNRYERTDNAPPESKEEVKEPLFIGLLVGSWIRISDIGLRQPIPLAHDRPQHRHVEFKKLMIDIMRRDIRVEPIGEALYRQSNGRGGTRAKGMHERRISTSGFRADQGEGRKTGLDDETGRESSRETLDQNPSSRTRSQR